VNRVAIADANLLEGFFVVQELLATGDYSQAQGIIFRVVCHLLA